MNLKLSFDECKWLLKCYWTFNDVQGLNLVRCHKGNNNKNPDKFEVDGMVQDLLKGGSEEREVPLIKRVLMQSCRLWHNPQRSH